MAMADISFTGTSQLFQRKTNVSLYNLSSSFLPQKPVKFSFNFNTKKCFPPMKIVCSVAPSQTQTPTPAPTTTLTADGKRTDCFGIFCLTYDLKEEEKQKSWKKLIKVAVSGAAGMISNHLLFMIASGEAFGQDQPISLQLLGSERSFAALEGVAMELEDSLYPLLREVSIGVDPNEVFRDVEWALLIGAKPRGPGMERADLLDINGQIFAEQGKALNAVASPNVKVLVVGNPCNTNALICLKNAPKIPPKNFHALTRLDENRAKCQLALKAGVFYDKVSNMTIWGNHSTTQVPDFLNAKINGIPVKEIITDIKWLEDEFTKKVQTRGGVLIKKWGRSSAASTAVSIVDAIKSLTIPTPEGDWFSSGVTWIEEWTSLVGYPTTSSIGRTKSLYILKELCYPNLAIIKHTGHPQATTSATCKKTVKIYLFPLIFSQILSAEIYIIVTSPRESLGIDFLYLF